MRRLIDHRLFGAFWLWAICAPLVLAACATPASRDGAPQQDARTARQDTPSSETERPLGRADETGTPHGAPDTPGQWRIALLVPLSGPDRVVGEALLNAASLALFDAVDPRLTLLPFDTAGSESGAIRAAEAAREAGASIILGPLRAENVPVVAAMTPGIPLISFSNDRTVAAPGRYIFGITPEAEVARITAHAVALGHTDFAALLPEGLYGDRVLAAYGDALMKNGALLLRFERYAPNPDNVFEPIRRLADYDGRRRALTAELRALEALNDDMTDAIADRLGDREVLGDVPFGAVLVAEGGALLRTVAPLFPFYEADSAQLLGTGLMNDPTLASEPPLYGARFAAPEPEAARGMMDRYAEIYGTHPPRLMTLAYDAVGLAATLVQLNSADPFAPSLITAPNGYMGVDGLFRFLPAGEVERALAVVEITADGLTVVDPAPTRFGVFETAAPAVGSSAP